MRRTPTYWRFISRNGAQRAIECVKTTTHQDSDGTANKVTQKTHDPISFFKNDNPANKQSTPENKEKKVLDDDIACSQ